MRKTTRLRQSRSWATRLSLQALEDRCQPSTYTLTDLGTLGGGATAQAYDINDAGQVVGYATTAALEYHGFLWTDGVMTDLGTLATGSSSKGFGLNNNGQVVGYAAASGNNHAFLWEAGVMTDLFPVPQHSSANAVNDAGQVVGNYNLNHPFLWEDGQFTDLGGFGGSAAFGYALDINNGGQVVGSSFANNGSEGIEQQAFLWEDGLMTNLGALPGLLDSRAHGINELGQVVGFSSFVDPDTHDEVSESFLYSSGVMTNLNVPGNYNAAEDINDSGQIVGWMVAGSSRAYIYDNGVATDLNTLIPAGSGLTLTSATAINNAGQIVGYAIGGGQFHAFLLTPVLDGTPSVSVSDATVTERNTGTKAAVFNVSLSTASNQTVTVNFATSNGSTTAGDFQAFSGNLTFAPGQTTQQVTVQVNGDRIAEPNETFNVTLSQANNAIIADGQAVGAIIDDEPRITISDFTQLERNKGQTSLFVFTISLSAAYDQAVTTSFRTVNGSANESDFVAKTGTVTFAPGELTKTITIQVTGDTKKERDEIFFVDLFGPSSNALITKTRGVGTILNDD